jgi:hypothetical protein
MDSCRLGSAPWGNGGVRIRAPLMGGNAPRGSLAGEDAERPDRLG